jgi:excisionase family DNA binding protein
MQLLKERYRRDELVKILRVSKRTVTEYLKNGVVVPIGGRPICVLREEIARVLGLKNPLEEFQLLSAKEMAKRIGVSENSIYRYHKEGRLRCVKMSRTSRFFAADVKNFRRLSD